MRAPRTIRHAAAARLRSVVVALAVLSAGIVVWLRTSSAAEEPSFARSTTVTSSNHPIARDSNDAPESAAEALKSSEPDPATCRAFRGEHCADPRPDDFDADGVRSDSDCDDRDFSVQPGAPEIPCNGRDENCDGADSCALDADKDGARADTDCDDDDPRRSPLAIEIACNGLDENCDDLDLCDRDGDHVSTPDDCDDGDRSRHPLASDRTCDGVDQDCSGQDCCEQDADRDSVPCAADCDDRDPNAYPGRQIEPWERDTCLRRDLDCDGHLDGTNCL